MQTLYDKLWQSHVVHEESDKPGGMVLLYIDRHLVHEVTSPQAFEGLRLAGRKPWRLDSILAVADHNVPTTRYRVCKWKPSTRIAQSWVSPNSG
jgi:3-isopropylmalate/(R)-2-methylmalate dehydratase large subunit